MTRIAPALVLLTVCDGCASFPARGDGRGPGRAAVPTRPPVALAGPPEPAGTGTAGAASPPPLALDREDDRPAPEVLAETDLWLVELSRAHGPDAQRRAADLLANFATMARRLDPSQAMKGQARDIEQEARELATDPGWFGRTDRARDGLLESVAALERIADRRAALRPWIAAARTAARAIRVEEPFGIEQTAVQDAFRAVADAFRAAVTSAAGEWGRTPRTSGRSLQGEQAPMTLAQAPGGDRRRRAARDALNGAAG